MAKSQTDKTKQSNKIFLINYTQQRKLGLVALFNKVFFLIVKFYSKNSDFWTHTPSIVTFGGHFWR